MLPRAEAPARRLPYTTADMAERLAKRKAEQANQALRFGVTNPPAPAPEPKKSGGGWLSQVGNMAKSLVLTPAGTALDMIPYVANIPGVKGEGAWGYEPEDIGTSNFFQAGGQALEQSGRRLVGDVTAIPGLGKDSPSYTADQIRKYGVAEGLASAGLDYGNLALTAAPFVKPTGMAIGSAINDAKYAAYLRRTKSPFPDVVPPKPGTFIELVEDADGVLRVPGSTKSPATPATRLAEAQAQRALPAAEIAAQGGVRDAGVIRLPSGEPTPPKNNVRDLNAYRSKTNQVDPRALTKDRYGFLQDENFNPITNGLDQQQYDAVFLSYNPPGFRNLLDSLGFKPYNKEGMLTTNYKGLVPLYNDQFYLELNHNYHNGMGNYVDVYKRPQLWDFVSNDQLEYLGQAYGSDITRNLQTIIKDATPTQNAQASITSLSEAQTARELFAKRNLPPAPTAAELAQLQREATRAEMGISIDDIEFPPQGSMTAGAKALEDMANAEIYATEIAVREGRVNPGWDLIGKLKWPEFKKPYYEFIANARATQTAFDSYDHIHPEAWIEIGEAQRNSGFTYDQMPNEMRAIQKYFSNDYGRIQEYLSVKSYDPLLSNENFSYATQQYALYQGREKVFGELDEIIDNIDRAFRIVPPVTRPFTTYRGVSISNAADPYVIAFYRNLKPGDLIYDPGYSSTSINKTLAEQWAGRPDDVVLIIQIPKGTSVVHPISSWTEGMREFKYHDNAPKEKELLLGRNSTFRVIRNDGKFIEVELVPSNTSVTNVRTVNKETAKTMSFEDALAKVQDETVRQLITNPISTPFNPLLKDLNFDLPEGEMFS